MNSMNNVHRFRFGSKDTKNYVVIEFPLSMREVNR